MKTDEFEEKAPPPNTAVFTTHFWAPVVLLVPLFLEVRDQSMDAHTAQEVLVTYSSPLAVLCKTQLRLPCRVQAELHVKQRKASRRKRKVGKKAEEKAIKAAIHVGLCCADFILPPLDFLPLRFWIHLVPGECCCSAVS